MDTQLAVLVELVLTICRGTPVCSGLGNCGWGFKGFRVLGLRFRVEGFRV